MRSRRWRPWWAKAHPTPQGPEDRDAVSRRSKRLAAFEAAKLRRPEQLPDLPGAPLELTWHHEGHEVLIRHGGRVIWREAAWWECYERFGEVARLLRQKYGEALRDLVPTTASKLYLYGDKLSAPDFVEEVREALREGRVPSGG